LLFFLQVAQATSNQMSKRDLLRPYMDIIDKMLAQMVLMQSKALLNVEPKILQLDATICDSVHFSCGRIHLLSLLVED
jgi:hypothetical protein